jgi:uncharacterized protein (TIGR00661 family)
MLVNNGHKVVAVLVGKSNRRELPVFFTDKMNIPVYRFESPNFLPAPKNKKNNLWISIAYNVLKTAFYLRSISFIKKTIRESEADVVVNFYEILTGLSYAFFPPDTPYVSIAHQYFFLHPEYKFPPDSITELKLLEFFTRISCCKASRLFALSFSKKKDIPSSNLVVMPPLLRKEIFTCQVQKGDYLLGYLLNDIYADDIIEFQKEHPEVSMHFFWDRKEAPEETVINECLIFHRLNDKKFIEYMAGCKAYATTAGFESLCEAMYMKKPALMVPTHIEQSCNAYEASLVGAGIVSDRFDLEALLDSIAAYEENEAFCRWMEQAESYWMKAFNFEKEELVKNRLGYKFLLNRRK